MYPQMGARLRFAWLACVAVCATLIGHALAYCIEGRDLADARHAYFRPSLDLALALTLLLGSALVMRVLRGRTALRTVEAVPSVARLWLGFALVQGLGFALLETAEGNAPDAVGCVVEAFTALVVAVVLSLFWGIIELSAQAVACAYLRRTRPPSALWQPPAPAIVPPARLAERTGVRRFKRPPPAIA